MWAFEPAKKEWREVIRPIPKVRDRSHCGLYYDPGLKTVFAITTSGSVGVHVFDRDKKTWTKKCDLPRVSSEVQPAYDSTRKVHMVHTQGKWYELDMATGSVKTIKSPDEVIKAADKFPFKKDGKTGALVPAPNQLQEASVAYDPESKLTLLITKQIPVDDTYDNQHRNPVDLWAYDAEKDDWAEVKMAGAPPKGNTKWGLLVHDTDHKCNLLVNLLSVGAGFRGGQVDGLYAFRLTR